MDIRGENNMINTELSNKAIVNFDDEGYVKDYILIGGVDDGIRVDRLEESIETNTVKIRSHKLVDGKLIFDTERFDYLMKQKHITQLRFIREEECFTIINRGGIWYETLTEQEKNELMDWYQAWLEAPETLIIPEKPTWI